MNGFTQEELEEIHRITVQTIFDLKSPVPSIEELKERRSEFADRGDPDIDVMDEVIRFLEQQS